MRCYCMAIRVAKKKIGTRAHAGEDVEKLDHLYIAGGNEK